MPGRPDIDGMDRRSKWWLLIASLAALVVLSAAAVRENFLSEWQQLRRSYAKILRDKAKDDRTRALADHFGIRIEQNVVPQLGVVDRCITCHTGLDDPRMQGEAHPFRTHPGRYLQRHPPESFGCTVCHQGQGLATEVVDAHGRVPHWDYPMLAGKFMRTTCTRCHHDEDLAGEDGLFSQMDGIAPLHETDLVLSGSRLAKEKGCFGCHSVEGVGGQLGPDITFVGDKTRHGFDFSSFARHEPRTVESWLTRHFLEPSEVSPGTLMPNLGLNQQEAEALTAYMLARRRKVLSPGHRPRLRAEDVRAGGAQLSGQTLYAMNCSSCHGEDGDESEVPGIRTPALNNSDALAVASDDFYRHIISQGRSGTAMPGWGPGKGNLSDGEIDRIVAHIRRWQPFGADLADLNSASGDPGRGEIYYQGLCANCHGRKGEGGIGSSLNSPTFLAIASDSFLGNAIANGRPGTAMASWRNLSTQAVNDLLAHIRSWQPDPPAYREVRASMRSRPARSRAGAGRQLYLGKCAPCHGGNGEGGIGLRLNSPDLLGVVGDRYLYQAIVSGRPTTAMPAWSHLRADEVADLITYLRTWQPEASGDPKRAAPAGDYSLGEIHYKAYCRGCHGEDGEGGVGPQLANPVLLGSASNDVLAHWISLGRAGTAMQGFAAEAHGLGRLTREQISDVISYLRHLGARDTRPILRSGVGDPHVGEQLYRGSCASCHGPEGQGASGPQLNNPSLLRSASDGFLYATIVLGRSGTPMRSMVQGREGLAEIPPDRVQDIVAYMRLWESPKSQSRPRRVAEMSDRAIRSGEQHYAPYCSGCHGPTGRGEAEGDAYFAPALNNPEFLSAASDGYLLATIARGRSRTPMRPFGEGAGGIASLKSETISDIVSFIRTWQTGPGTTRGVTP